MTLVLSPTSISESSGVSTVTAETLASVERGGDGDRWGRRRERVAIAADFDLSAARTLTIASGSTTRRGRGDGDGEREHGGFAGQAGDGFRHGVGGNGLAAPSNVTLTLTDDEDLPEVTLVLSPTSVSETGGVSTVTAELSHPSSEAVTVTVSGDGRDRGGGRFQSVERGYADDRVGSTTSSGAVTVTAEGDTTDEPNETVSVSGTATGGNGVTAPTSVTLTIADDEVLPTGDAGAGLRRRFPRAAA